MRSAAVFLILGLGPFFHVDLKYIEQQAFACKCAFTLFDPADFGMMQSGDSIEL